MMTTMSRAILVAVLQLVVQGQAAVLLVAAGPEDATTVHAAVKTSRVGRPDQNYTTLFYFQQCPESPNGKRIVYTSLYPPTKPRGGEVCVCDADLTGHRRVGSVEKVSPHSGAGAIWIDDATIMFSDLANETVFRVNVDTGESASALGTVSQLCPVTRGMVFETMGRHSLPKGIHALNVDTLQTRRLVAPEDVKSFAGVMGKTYDARRWNLGHPYLSPDGTKLLFQIKADGLSNSNPQGDFVLWARADGSNIHLIGPKPMHVQWWDNETIFGHDWQWKRDHHLRRWDLDNNCVEELAGPGCHGAVSPDRNWIATESWYGSDPMYCFGK